MSSTGLKKNLDWPIERKRAAIDLCHPDLSIVEQCALLELPRSTLYYHPVPVSAERLVLMQLLDEQYTRTPFYGSRRMRHCLIEKGHPVGREQVIHLMRQMGLEAIYPKRSLSEPHPGHRVYPYLLRRVKVDHVDQVWSTDITYIRLTHGFIYLTAVIDWFSRYVLSWEISLTLDADFCVKALDHALAQGRPEIFNTDQGSQFTSEAFTGRLIGAGVAISMDGRGRALDNIFVERLWRTVKYEYVFLHELGSPLEAVRGFAEYFAFYNHERPHQALDYKTPAQVYQAGRQAVP